MRDNIGPYIYNIITRGNGQLNRVLEIVRGLEVILHKDLANVGSILYKLALLAHLIELNRIADIVVGILLVPTRSLLDDVVERHLGLIVQIERYIHIERIGIGPLMDSTRRSSEYHKARENREYVLQRSHFFAFFLLTSNV